VAWRRLRGPRGWRRVGRQAAGTTVARSAGREGQQMMQRIRREQNAILSWVQLDRRIRWWLLRAVWLCQCLRRFV